MAAVGCSNGNGDSKDDMCIMKTDTKAKVCYGMAKVDVEKVLGKGKPGVGTIDYVNGAGIFYRNDKVAYIRLSDESINVFSAASGIKVGDTKKDVLKQYGEKNAITNQQPEFIVVDYVYDSKEKKFVNAEEYENIKDDSLKEHYVVSIKFEDDVVEQLFIGDLQAMTRLQ